MSAKIRKGDRVIVTTGRDKGKKGEVLKVFPSESRALVAGVNVARHEAYRALLARGHHTLVQGVAMHRGNEPGYNRPGVYALDDWR